MTAAMEPGHYDVVVIGAGVVGAGAACRLAADGATVLLVDADWRGGLGSRAAAGIGVPSARLLNDPLMREFTVQGARALAEDLRRVDPSGGLSRSCGVLRPFRGREEADRLASLPGSAELLGERLPAPAVAELEPALDVSRMAGAFLAGNGMVVDVRSYVDGLLAAARASGARLLLGHRARLDSAGPPHRVTLRPGDPGTDAGPDGVTVTAGIVVVAAGAWTGQVMSGAGQIEVGPRRGQMIRLGDLPGARLTHIVSGSLYLAPGVGGGLLVGATEEDCGFDPAPTLEGVLLLAAHASRTVPAARAATIERIWYGFRSVTPTGRPVIGWSALPGVLVASGHGGQGILTGSLTADMVAALCAGRPVPESVAFAPRAAVAR
jgi:glycine oxidase